MADVKWIKICTDIFENEKITLIENMPNSDSVIVIWFKLLCMAGKQNNGGVFMLNDKIAYTEEMFATLFHKPVEEVHNALNIFEQFDMVSVVNNTYTIPNWGKHQNLDQLESKKEYMRSYMQEYREKQKKLTSKTNSKVYGKVNSKTNVRQADKDIDIDIEEDKDNNIYTMSDSDQSETVSKSKNPEKHKYGEYKNVLLTNDELSKLKEEFPEDYEKRIENLSSYIASTGKRYKSHYATIRNWAKKEQPKQQTEIHPSDEKWCVY